MTRSDAELTTIKQDLIAQGIKYCVGAYVDLHGVPKGKVVPVGHFEDFAGGSELYTGYALDGLGQSPNDDEIASVPDLTRGVRLPWQPEVMWYPADLSFHGTPYRCEHASRFWTRARAGEGDGFQLQSGDRMRGLFRERGRRATAHSQCGRRPDEELLRREALLRSLSPWTGSRPRSTVSAGTCTTSITKMGIRSSNSTSNTPMA